jgi:hypothetical protein
MQTIFLRHDFRQMTSKLRRVFADRSHADRLVLDDTLIIAPNGEITALFLRQQIARNLYEAAYRAWRQVKQVPSNRATAVGTEPLPRLRKDGGISERRGVPQEVLTVLKKQRARYGVLGYLDATPDCPCHLTPLSIKHPEMLEGGRSLIERVDELYAFHIPSLHAVQLAEVRKAPSFRLWNTAITTVYINGIRTAYHTDSGNLRGVMSAITPLGNFTGGELVLPRWRVAFAYKPGDVLFLDPQQLHGNLPVHGDRLGAVFYCEKRIAECGACRDKALLRTISRFRRLAVKK